MGDNEIIKALECCITKRNQYCISCSFSKETNCTLKMLEKTLDLINRQKAEIERLKRYDEERDIALHARLIANAKTEAIREFAENVKIAINERFSDEIQACNPHFYLVSTLVDGLVEEMEGGNEQNG